MNQLESHDTVNVTVEETFFTKISKEDRRKVKKWWRNQKATTEAGKNFLKIIKNAIREINSDYWIATIEPSIKDGKIHYIPEENVGLASSAFEWKRLAKGYNLQRCSRLGTLYELYLWYALRIVNGFWTFDEVTKDSSNVGNYCDSPNYSNCMDKSGAKIFGGYADGQGNTYKLVNDEGKFVIVGGAYINSGKATPIAYTNKEYFPNAIRYFSSAVVVLTR